MSRQDDSNDVPVNAPRFERRTACAVTQGGILWSCIAGETDGVRRLFVNDGTGMRALEGYSNPAHPTLSPVSDGMGLLFTEQAGDNLSRIIYRQLNSSSQPVVVRETENLCATPALCSYGGQAAVVWTELQNGVFSILFTLLQDDGFAEPLKISRDGEQSFRPAITAYDQHLYIAWEADADDGRILYVQHVQNGQTRRLCLPGARLSNVSLDADACGNCHIACISARDVIDGSLDISEHRVSIAYSIWDGEGNTVLAEVLPMNEGLLGKLRYRSYFGIRRRVTVRANHGIALFWEMLYEDRTASLSHPPAGGPQSYSHSGYLTAARLSGGVWESPKILHASGSLYSVACLDDDRINAACLTRQT